MEPNNFEVFSQRLQVMADVFNRKLSAEAVAEYYDLLEPYQIGVVLKAIKAAIAEARAWPLPAVILEYAVNFNRADLERHSREMALVERKENTPEDLAKAAHIVAGFRARLKQLIGAKRM